MQGTAAINNNDKYSECIEKHVSGPVCKLMKRGGKSHKLYTPVQMEGGDCYLQNIK
jgi:hypothetical protein